MTAPAAPDAPWIASSVRIALDAAGRGIADGKPGTEIARELTAAVEATILEVLAFHFAEARIGDSSGGAVLATGSFGRRELAPASDLDLLFLCAKNPGAKIEALAHAILVPLWDAKVDAGQAVRSVADGLGLPEKDLAAATALLDARFMIGDRRLAADFLARYERKVAGSTPDSMVGRLREEQESR